MTPSLRKKTGKMQAINTGHREQTEGSKQGIKRRVWLSDLRQVTAPLYTGWVDQPVSNAARLLSSPSSLVKNDSYLHPS